MARSGILKKAKLPAEVRTPKNEVGAYKLSDDQKQTGFVLNSPVGRFEVDPQGARCEGIELASNTAKPGTTGMFVGERKQGRTGTFREGDRHEVTAIEVGAKVWILASARPAGGDKMGILYADDTTPGPFVIIDGRIDELGKRDARLASLYKLIAGVLLLSAAALLLTLG